MLETSKDLLNLIIAFCLLWFTIFLCWMIYYVALIFKRIHEVMEKLTATLDAVSGFFTSAKDKLTSVGSTIATAMEVGKRVADFVEEKRANHEAKQEKKSARQKK
ncbi:MAG: hypothetical protein UV78_C0069G0003 [Parcubacteria group bacterium GW2011_GWA2_43_17]|nr:MAG: hypothetical protein UV78_C0069G0003 [Parcubacteria group bacterium GW2011_GWA2_43_17]KKT91375.1 MAG: hypothetical protein UW91_C0033G0005 [Parcubacteria group bacterium GW2011_GWF2_45_11]KKT97060.1 MAG: hypothetical protein UW98_C0025G0006 [Parcubacteria group bacterium GW2011_GWC2_45_15]OGY92407.1 MAG: hypothetical protein A2260_01840 [Candidatus Komeilibacteria bacterium RIFOXYA2_FULL_45_9]OGY96166.1 MAG: hypothetical protein A3J95_01155 [Candidatus Komeilibacteria bacterium RIFOXYC2